jgi:hypothetical protein
MLQQANKSSTEVPTPSGFERMRPLRLVSNVRLVAWVHVRAYTALGPE